jgi:hypothetical protein
MGATQKLSRRLATVRLLTTGETFAWVASGSSLKPHKTACERFYSFLCARKNAPYWVASPFLKKKEGFLARGGFFF